MGPFSLCFRHGFRAGYNQHIRSVDEFLVNFGGPYRKIVDQPLHYDDGAAPPNKIKATLGQCYQLGFGLGSVKRAKEILSARAARRPRLKTSK